nr:MAG TPA: hypothetical protein [Bacteriophage sp.]
MKIKSNIQISQKEIDISHFVMYNRIVRYKKGVIITCAVFTNID